MPPPDMRQAIGILGRALLQRWRVLLLWLHRDRDRLRRFVRALWAVGFAFGVGLLYRHRKRLATSLRRGQSKQAVLTLQCATRCLLSRRAFAEELSTFEDQNSFANLFARAANASAAAAHASEAQGGTRTLSFDATAALLEALALDGSIVTFIAYNDFGYKGKYAVPKAEREYWLKISRDKLPTSLREKFPGLLVADDLVIMHVHYDGDYPYPGDRSRPRIPLHPHRMVITQINVRHTWQGGGPLSSYPCEDPGGALHGMLKESSGEPVLVANPGWNWRDSREKGKQFAFSFWIRRPRRLESRLLEPKHTASLQDLLDKGEMYADHGGRKVRKKFFGLAQSPSGDGAEDGMGLNSSAAGGAMEWTVTEWSARTVPVPVRRPFKILFVGVNENERIKSQLDLKREQQLIQDMIYKYFRDIFPKPEFKPIPHGTWGEVIRAVQEENPTILHVGSHSIGKGQQAGVHLASGATVPMQMIPAIKTHNEGARRKNKPDLRMVVLNACESDAHAEALLQCVDFAIGHNSEVDDERAVEFSDILYDNLFGKGNSLAESFDMAKGCSAVDAYRLFGNCDATKFFLVEPSTVSESAEVGAASQQYRKDDASSIATPGADKDGTSAAARGAVESDAGTGAPPQLAEFDPTLRERLCCPEFGFGPPAPGLQWRKIGVEKPKKGSKLKHEALAEALKHRTEFTQREFAEFQVFRAFSLTYSSYIKVGDNFFQPIAPPGFEEVLLQILKLLREMGVRSEQDLCKAVLNNVITDCTIDQWPLFQLDRMKVKNLRKLIMEESTQVQPKAAVNESSRPIEGVVSATIRNAGGLSNDHRASPLVPHESAHKCSLESDKAEMKADAGNIRVEHVLSASVADNLMN
jgi:hypothetical protein